MEKEKKTQKGTHVRRKNIPNIRLQVRDYDILSFLLEQKFASLEMIYLGFFDERKSFDEAPQKNFQTARQRLAKLRQHKLIKTQIVPSSGKAHFLITRLGVNFLESHTEEETPIREAKRIDFSLYNHDYKINMIRILLKIKGKCRAWYSEKLIRAAPIPLKDDGFKFQSNLFPDAVFINSKGERVALELEVSRKGLSRVREKLEEYDYLIRMGVLDKIWIVATKPSIIKTYSKAISILFGGSSYSYYNNEERTTNAICFRVDNYNKVFSPNIMETEDV